MEEWRRVAVSPRYEVSNTGKIRGGKRGGVLQPDTTTGYERVALGKIPGSTKYIRRLVHVVVAEAFIGPCPEGHEVNHKDGNKRHNAPENLEYVTRKQNISHAYERLEKFSTHARGSRHGMARLREDDARTIFIRRKNKEDARQIAAEYGVEVSTIHLIARKATWREATKGL